MTGLFPFLPVFVDLAGRAAVLLSGDAALATIARRLLDAGAGVTVLDREVSAAMADLAPSVRLLRRRWRPLDLAGAALVVAGAGEPRPARARMAAKAAGAIFTMPGAGGQDRSEVIFGAAAAWGPVAIGVTASGLDPGLGEAVARRLEAAVPASYAGFLAAAGRMRAMIDREIPESGARDAFWRAAAADAFDAHPDGAAGWDGWLKARIGS